MSEPFWSHASQVVLSTLCQLSMVEGLPKLRSLLFETPLDQLIEILSHTRARMVLTKEADKTAGSIVAHLSAQAQGLRFLQTPKEIQQDRIQKNTHTRSHQFNTHVKDFSLNQWCDQKEKNWLFLTTSAQDRAALIPVLRCALDTIIRATMRQEKSRKDKPLWFIIDELPSLKRLTSLQTLAAEGRKYGAAIVTCIQSLGQLEAIYGRSETQCLLDLFGTKITFRTPNIDSAQWISRTLGTTTQSIPSENISLTNTSTSSWSGSLFTQKEPLVSAHEIMSLKNLHAFVSTGSHPVIQTRMGYKKISKKL